jgi:hypothetical protein
VKRNIRWHNTRQRATAGQGREVYLTPAGYELLSQAQQHHLGTANVKIGRNDQYTLGVRRH